MYFGPAFTWDWNGMKIFKDRRKKERNLIKDLRAQAKENNEKESDSRIHKWIVD